MRKALVMKVSFVLLLVPLTALGATGFPKGYLVPTPVSIPRGLSQIERLYPPYSDDGYVLEYRAADNQGILAVSENLANPQWDANKLIQGSEMLVQQSKKGRVTEKVRDITYKSAHGALFHAEYLGIRSYDLIMDDNNRVLRIQAQDGPDFYFTDDMVMGVLHGMVRQE